MEYYSVPLYSSTLEFLQHLSRRLGKLKKGGVPDVLASARAVLQDFNQGNVSYYVEAPAEYKPERQLAAAVVSEVQAVQKGASIYCSDAVSTVERGVRYRVADGRRGGKRAANAQAQSGRMLQGSVEL
jgi:hypothetical protein